MNLHLDNKGFTAIEGVMVVVVLAIVVALGVAFYNVSTKKSTSTESQTTTQQLVKDVKSTSDLDAASTDLDQLNLEDTDDSAQLDSQQSAF